MRWEGKRPVRGPLVSRTEAAWYGVDLRALASDSGILVSNLIYATFIAE